MKKHTYTCSQSPSCLWLDAVGARLWAWIVLVLCSYIFQDMVARAQVASSWPGMAQTGVIPPDPHGAAGPGGVIQTVNLNMAYFRKDGSYIWGPVPLATFFSGVGARQNGI